MIQKNLIEKLNQYPSSLPVYIQTDTSSDICNSEIIVEIHRKWEVDTENCKSYEDGLQQVILISNSKFKVEDYSFEEFEKDFKQTIL